MSTGPTHAISGLAAWAGVTALASGHAIGELTPQAWVVGAALASGAALLPDIDHPSSTVARTFGPFSQAVSGVINTVSGWTYRATKTRKDPKRDGGHRGLTHTVLFALVAGLVTTAIVQAGNRYALPVLMFVFCGLAVRGLMNEWSPKRDAVAIAVASGVLTLACLRWVVEAPENAAAAGIAVMIGCVAHYLGDAITEQGCPMLWPIPIKGKTWFPVAPPKPMRMRTGGAVELSLVLPGLTLLAVYLSAAALQRTGAVPWLGFDLLGWLPGAAASS
ncbi:LexA-binding, inner membrane-associated putative hydrolase [Streptoalloteichus tenebrarius]|uniref:LexA-binding, inner membrane-associated putative hydrolase n=1 Tax=Streptoalloteichus tenebrarius (strain ATCC 17920 / DSM 40477 / JCM 4838 / CBS 697.72 / NBRC 16177 / NCIMB 11028 / NRRL B-12390 / A12253. 1 / ISP 5477) TaxID=1933 RepID=A0ABT1I186_STRSD|nr:metal-dependent hydrolase [Streptoalloteichus tenebrarius]MCP2261540.1 LexA-binding, inner membrane-associated putative hydrolase [Streptoalloteichus tenebrarius]